jgi:hypothetical protein
MSRDDRHSWTYTSGAGTAYINPSYEIHLCVIWTCAWCGYKWLLVANFKDYETSLHQFTKSQYKTKVRGRRGCMVVGLPMQLVPIATKVVGLNPVRGKVYSIQHCWIKCVNDLRQYRGRWFSPGTPVSSTNKTDHHELT